MLHPAIVARRDGSIHGCCLVTTRLIEQGEAVWDLDEPTCTWKEIESWPEDRRKVFDWYGFQCGVDRYALPEGLSREMNHSCDPNTWWSGNTTLVARRDIQPGEEITYDYSTADVDPGFEMECTCKSSRCRGKISNRDYLDPEWQRRYGSNLPPHVLAAIGRAEWPLRESIRPQASEGLRGRSDIALSQKRRSPRPAAPRSGFGSSLRR